MGRDKKRRRSAYKDKGKRMVRGRKVAEGGARGADGSVLISCPVRRGRLSSKFSQDEIIMVSFLPYLIEFSLLVPAQGSTKPVFAKD